MDAPDSEEALKAELDDLKSEHRDLDARIEELSGAISADQLALKRLKKRKLALKDRIARIEDQLYPDIIA